MEFAAKIRAGRAVLSWNREDLAVVSGVSVPAIKNIETGQSNPTAKTQRRVLQGFESQGVFFTEDGVEYRTNRIRYFRDFHEVLEDARISLKKGDEILLHCADERKNSEEVTAHFQEILQHGIKLRFTIGEGNDYITTSSENYRMINSEVVKSAEVSVTYADKHLIHVTDHDQDTYVLIKNKPLAETKKREFEFWWSTGRPYAKV